MHKIGTSVFVLLPCLAYVIMFRQAWVGIFTPDIPTYIGVFLVLAFLTYMFLHGAYYIVRTGKKVSAEMLPLNSMDSVAFQAYFKRKVTELDASRACIARFEADGDIHYELMGISRIFGIIPDRKTDIYVIAHKTGVKTDYQVKTREDIVRNILLGVPFAIMLAGWIILFVARGI